MALETKEKQAITSQYDNFYNKNTGRNGCEYELKISSKSLDSGGFKQGRDIGGG